MDSNAQGNITKSVTAILVLLLTFGLSLVIHGAIPFISTPTLGQAVVISGYPISFMNSGTIFATNFGYPQPSPMSTMLAVAMPMKLIMSFGVHPADAYTVAFILWLALGFLGAYWFARLLGASNILSALLTLLWMCLPITWNSSGYAHLHFGLTPLPFYLLCATKLFYLPPTSYLKRISWLLVYLVCCVLVIFTDGYSFMMFAAITSILFASQFWRTPSLRIYLLRLALPVHLIGLGGAYFLFSAYVGKGQYEAAPIAFFRSWGLDVSFLLVPSKGVHWLWDALGISIARSSHEYFGDASIWVSTFSLPLIVMGVIAWLKTRKISGLSISLLLIALFGFYMSLGPSLKINATKPEPAMGALMPEHLGVISTGSEVFSKYLPGFKNMRASYRWWAIGFLGLWGLLVLFVASEQSARVKKWNGLILVLLVAAFVPDIPEHFRRASNNRDQFFQIDEELLKGLHEDLRAGEVTAFLPYNNDFLVSYLAAALKIRAYNVGGDKNLVEARKHWPKIMQSFKMGEIGDDFSEKVQAVLVNGEADVVILPYVDMLWAAHQWPYPLKYKAQLAPVLAELAELEDIKLEMRELYTVVRLKPDLDSSGEAASED